MRCFGRQPTCPTHIDDPCDGDHGVTRRDCSRCPAPAPAPHENCVYCRRLPQAQQHLWSALQHITDYETDPDSQADDYNIKIAKHFLVGELTKLQSDGSQGAS